MEVVKPPRHVVEIDGVDPAAEIIILPDPLKSGAIRSSDILETLCSSMRLALRNLSALEPSDLRPLFGSCEY